MDGIVLDPMEHLPSLCVQLIVSMLDARSLAACCSLNKAWRTVSEQDGLWGPLCKALWADKSHVPPLLAAERCMRRAYALSLTEADRDVLSEEELCTCVWSFQFRDVGPGSWFPAATFRRYFHADHQVDTRPILHFWAQPRIWSLRWEDEAKGSQCVQVNEYPPMKVSRQPDWSWRLDSPWVTMASDHKAGLNPGQEALSEPQAAEEAATQTVTPT